MSDEKVQAKQVLAIARVRLEMMDRTIEPDTEMMITEEEFDPNAVIVKDAETNALWTKRWNEKVVAMREAADRAAQGDNTAPVGPEVFAKIYAALDDVRQEIATRNEVIEKRFAALEKRLDELNKEEKEEAPKGRRR